MRSIIWHVQKIVKIETVNQNKAKVNQKIQTKTQQNSEPIT